jgi:hypothetical protein
VRYAIVGGIALIHHVRLRATDDIDAIVVLPQIAMPAFFEDMKASGFSLDVMTCIRQLRDDGLTSARYGGVIVDLMRPILPTYTHVLDRAVETQLFGRSVSMSSAEGLIVMKVLAMRPQDETDVRDLLATYAGSLDLDFVRRELDAVMESNDPRRVKFEEWAAESSGTAPD